MDENPDTAVTNYSDHGKSKVLNMVKHIRDRKLLGSINKRSIPAELHSRIGLHRRLMGHLSPVYCVCFDQTGQYIFTGADDHLIKIWSARDGRLLKTLRGHEGEITDMSVNYENRLLASGGMDRVIRIWDLKTSKLLDCLNAHNAMVTSVKFAPYNRHGSDRYLISTSNDGSVIFWVYHVDKFQFRKLKKFQERNRPGGRIVCSSFSTGGSFLACGSSDNYIHIYGFHPDIGPYWLDELPYHTKRVDSIQFSNYGFRFISGSQDGNAVVWTYKKMRWVPLRLDMNTQLDQTVPRLTAEQHKPAVLIVQWSRDDRHVLTSVVDYSIKIWDSQTGNLLHILREHMNDTYLIESHPIDPRIFISASHDGKVIIWDIESARAIKILQSQPVNDGPGTSSAPIHDIKFSPDGNMIAATDSHGHLSLYGNGSGEAYMDVPDQMFFHTDYRALIRDIRHFVMDEQTHIAPHLMPTPNLVDMNGYPYPDILQRFVPDYKNGERFVIPPLSDTQINIIADIITNHSKQEDEEYIFERRYHDDDDVLKSGSYNMSENGLDRFTNQHGECSRYNTRYSTRYSFRTDRDGLMERARRTRSRVRYFDEEDDDEESSHRLHENDQQRRRPRRHRQQLHGQMNNSHSDSSTEEYADEDDETEIETEIETDSETEVESDDATVIDSDATEIDDSVLRSQKSTRTRVLRKRRSSLRPLVNSLSREPEATARRCSARLRERKRIRIM